MEKKIIIIGMFLLIMVSFSSLVWKENISLTDEVLPTELAIFLEDQETNAIPSQESGYYFDRTKSSCNNGSIEWDSVNWNPNIKVNSNATTRTKCNLVFTTNYNEGILNGTDPVIKDELIPVKIEENGTVRKADLKSKWYEYANQNWANAVIVRNDYAVLNDNGKVNGATKGTGYVTFDGVDDYIDLGLENYDFGTSVAAAIKFRINEEKTFSHILTNVEASGISIERKNSKIQISVYSESRKSYVILASTDSLELGKDYVVVLNYNGEKLQCYINGILVSEIAYTENIVRSPVPFFLGANPSLTGNHADFTATDIYQAAIYNRALSENEIKNNMNNDIKITDNTGLLSYVDFTNKTDYEANEIIPEENIESYFTWIPRYKYQIFDEGNYPTGGNDISSLDTNALQTINVIFESRDVTPSTETTIGSWLTHPAFTSFNSNGMWVGKFETSKSFGSDNTRNGAAVQIKPNASSWGNIQVSNAFYTSYDYKRNLDSHMMKNTEWGAIAYLQHSAYGSRENVRINNNSSYVTGYAANNDPTCGYTGTNEDCNKYCNDGSCNVVYPNNPSGGSASTTGNISGIYDMAGGAWEYMMSVMLDENRQLASGRNSTNHSGFNGTLTCPTCDGDISGKTNITDGYDWPEAKYYDTYAYQLNNAQHYERRILGDATGEVGPFGTAKYLTQSRVIGSWYSDLAYFVYSGNPWFVRGGTRGSGIYAGVFAFDSIYGHAISYVSFRVVLTP